MCHCPPNEEVYTAAPIWPQPRFKLQGEWEGREIVCVLCVCLCKRESERMRCRATRLTEAIRSIISPTVEGLMHTIVSV